MKKLAVATLIGITLFLNTQAQSNKPLPPERPKLIVQFIVGQMRNDFLHRYWQNFSEDGFKVLVNEGSFCKNARYNYLLTQSAPGVATLLTGAQPASHGIVSDRWLSRANNEMVTATFDKRYRGVGGDDMYGSHSPRNMMASTLGDELKRWNPKSKVIAISLDPTQAVLAAGHSGDGAYWMNPYYGTWMTSNFYQKDLPDWVSDFNKKQFADAYIQRAWETLLPMGSYLSPDISAIDTIKKKDMEETKKNPLTLIKSLFAEKTQDKNFEILRTTPYGNSYSKDFALSAIVNENMGKDETTDLLTIYFAPTAEICKKYGTSSVELEDTYYRLDQELGHFMSFLNETIGRENVLIVFTSDHGTSDSPGKNGTTRVPGGTFEPKQSIALLKSYLSVTYGKGEWIKAYDQKQIFLNRSLIEDSNLKLEDFQDKVSEFMVQFSGVAGSTTATTLTNTSFNQGNLLKTQNSYNPKRSGDILFFLEPGWTERGETSSAQSSPYSYDSHVPLVFYGWKIKRKSILIPMDIADVAPTTATLIDISWPNAASGKPLEEMFK